jgi:hypothetical protein
MPTCSPATAADRADRGAIAVAVVYVGLTGWILMLAARFAPEVFRYNMLVFGGVLPLYAASAWIRHRIAQAELKTREQLLEIELRLAEIAENRSTGTP